MNSLSSIRIVVNAGLNSKKDITSKSLIKTNRPDINIRYYRVNVIVGKQSLGKTVVAIEEIIRISLLGTHHLLIYVTKNGVENDLSFQALKPLLKIPYVTIGEKEAKPCNEELIAAKYDENIGGTNTSRT